MKLFKTTLFIIAAFCLTLSVFAQVREPQKPTNVTANTAAKVESPASAPGFPTAPVEIKSEQIKAATDDTRENRYRIGLLDQIEVLVYRHPELSLVVAVNEQGLISLPRSEKPFAVVCKTESELQAEIIKEYSKFLRQPFVNVRVTQQNSQPFAVIGAVEKPSNFFLNRRITLLELLTYAGGAKIEKAGTKVQIARVGGVSGCLQNDEAAATEFDKLFETYSLKDVYENRTNPWMRPGDIVRVLEADEVYVVGNVFKPQAIVLKDGLTVSQAIAAAGGTLSSTKKDKIVIRRQRNGSNDTIAVDLQKIDKKELPDILLLPEDIVDVPTDKSRKILSDIFKGLTQGIPTVLSRTPIP